MTVICLRNTGVLTMDHILKSGKHSKVEVTFSFFNFPLSSFVLFLILFLFFYRIKYIYLNAVTFIQIIISWILRNRLSDSLWRSGMENMLRQIGNLFYTLSHFFYGFHLYYLVLSTTFQFFLKY